jgi:predicted regulator of Ras-like GTPase activity (Roadblock/LC7/MglB family)
LVIVVDKEKIEKVVADTMASNADIEGIIVCDAKGKVVFGHTLAGGIKHADVAKLVVQIAANSSKLTASTDKGGLKEVSIASEKGFVIILGDVKVVLAAIAGEAARESMGLLRMALKRALLSIVG